MYSCGGHENLDPGCALYEAYVLFTATSQASVRALMDTIPNFGERFRYDGSQALIRNVWISVVRLQDTRVDPDALVYRLSIAGAPLFYQREQLRVVEDALSMAVALRCNTPGA